MRSASYRISPAIPSMLVMLGFATAAITLTMVAKDELLLVAAGAYAAMYMVLAWFRPDITLMLIFASAPFQNDLSEGSSPAKFSIAEIHLALAVPVFVIREITHRRGFRLGPVAISAIPYLLVCIFSMIMNWHGDARDRTGIVAFSQMVLYMIVAVTLFSSFCPDPRKLFLPLQALVVVGVFLALVGVATGSNYFLGLHKNGVGASLASCVVVGAELWFSATERRSKYILGFALAVMLAGLAMSLSRGAWIATFLGLIILLTLRRNFKLLAQMVIMMIPLAATAWMVMTPLQRDYVTGFQADRPNIALRYESAQFSHERFTSSPVYGVGVYLRKEYDATNIAMCVLAETGVVGLIGFVLIFITIAWMCLRAVRYLPHDTKLFSLVALAMALSFGRLAHGMVDHYWSRGAILQAWGSVGMATAAYYAAMQRRAWMLER